MTAPAVGEIVREPSELVTEETPAVRQVPFRAKQPEAREMPPAKVLVPVSPTIVVVAVPPTKSEPVIDCSVDDAWVSASCAGSARVRPEPTTEPPPVTVI